MNKKFEIPRDKLLEIKHSNYELYQLICSFATNEEEKDYCEILEKAKLAKECELGYFNIEDLFTKEQICNAYNRGYISDDGKNISQNYEHNNANKLGQKYIYKELGTPEDKKQEDIEEKYKYYLKKGYINEKEYELLVNTKESFTVGFLIPEKDEFSPDHYSYLKEEFTFESAKKLAEDFKNDASFSLNNREFFLNGKFATPLYIDSATGELKEEKGIKDLPFPSKTSSQDDNDLALTPEQKARRLILMLQKATQDDDYVIVYNADRNMYLAKRSNVINITNDISDINKEAIDLAHDDNHFLYAIKKGDKEYNPSTGEFITI